MCVPQSIARQTDDPDYIFKQVNLPTIRGQTVVASASNRMPLQNRAQLLQHELERERVVLHDTDPISHADVGLTWLHVVVYSRLWAELHIHPNIPVGECHVLSNVTSKLIFVLLS